VVSVGAGDVAVPILTWHAMHVDGPAYRENDHTAFRDDLEAIHRLGYRVVPLHEIASALVEGRLESLRGCVGLSFDDGSDFDFHDLPHPAWGPQRGIARILADFRARHGTAAQPTLHATTFVIVSPAAREELDRTCMIGCRWWNDDWWREAERGGLMAVESHSWDHNHESMAATATRAPRAGFQIENSAEADVEILQAAEVLRELRGRGGDVLLAYPYGDSSDFLRDDYLPRVGARHGIVAAFGAGGGCVTPSSSRWDIPRLVFGQDWATPEELEQLLARGASSSRPAASVAPAPSPGNWRDHLRTWEVHDAKAVAGELFRRCFGHDIPDYRRHFVLVYSPPAGAGEAPSVIAYVHQTPQEDFHLCGGMCVDERAYRRFPPWLFRQVREAGGLATVVTRDSMGMLGESLASFGHVGEPRARAADLRTGFVDAGPEHLMVMWLKAADEKTRRRLVERVAALGPF
jgi:peptidoglycan/xylan/chitin deacetylase (PgdA/CDA1 family)